MCIIPTQVVTGNFYADRTYLAQVTAIPKSNGALSYIMLENNGKSTFLPFKFKTDVGDVVPEPVKPEEPEEENVDDILENSLPKYEYTYKEKSKAPLYVLLGVLAAAIIAAIVYLYLFKVVPSTPVKNMNLSQYNGKMEEYISYLYPPTASTAEENFNANYGSAEDYNTKLQTSFTETYGEGYTVSVQVLDVDRATDQMLEAFLSEIEDETEKAKITDLVYVTVKLKVKGDISTDIAASMGTAVKYDGEWYVYQ